MKFGSVVHERVGVLPGYLYSSVTFSFFVFSDTHCQSSLFPGMDVYDICDLNSLCVIYYSTNYTS